MNNLAARHRAEQRFRLYGILAILGALAALTFLIGTIVVGGIDAFRKTVVALDIALPAVTSQNRDSVDFEGMAKMALRELVPPAPSREQQRKLNALLSTAAGDDVAARATGEPHRARVWVRASSSLDQYIKGNEAGRLDPAQRDAVTLLQKQGRIATRFNTEFFTEGDSRSPEQAGILSALVGSLYAVGIAMVLSLPLGICAAIYLEEFARRGRVTDFLEVNINNLAAIPSILYGLLGLAVFLNFFGLPRSSPLVGGLVLALMTLPAVIVTTRASLRTVPPSIREAAYGIGASRWQVVLHHVLPLSVPGIMTGAILGMARALGETAPLLLIGMVAFIADVPRGPLSPSTALPIQVYLWANAAERGFAELSSACIMVLLLVMLVLNAAAILIRKRFERQW
ncbi:MAG TPA: phosphate ABC transporter permease PstA [Dongiaceae bacterium]|jgi:phosphate transport system permease protein|nr:phosphate ABC transporter permease PstA [Dongiaceae bacterium]